MPDPIQFRREHRNGLTSLAIDEVNGNIWLQATVFIAVDTGEAPLAICDQVASEVIAELESLQRNTRSALAQMGAALSEQHRKEVIP